jgi:hypothetical protein
MLKKLLIKLVSFLYTHGELILDIDVIKYLINTILFQLFEFILSIINY